MPTFTTTISKFDKQGEKTSWTYITIPQKIAQQIKPGTKKSFRVKGKLDNHPITQIALLPMGKGDFIMPLNAAMRKGIGKAKGAKVVVQIQQDKVAYKMNEAFIECLQDEPAAMIFFKTFPVSHQCYYSKWIDAAKTEYTSTKRIAQAVTALSRKMNFAEMLHHIRDEKNIGL